MNGVRFGIYHSFDDFSIILITKTIETPKPKTEYVEIPGADEPLDYTEYFGDVKYSTRKLTFEFETKLRHLEFYDMFDEIKNALNGQRMKIYLDEDQLFYFDGRLQVNEYKSNEKIGKIVIEAECNPYKMENYETLSSFTLTGQAQQVDLINLRKRVVPQIIVETSESVSIEFGNNITELSSGTWTIPELELVEGYNHIILNGTGKISFNYRRGKL